MGLEDAPRTNETDRTEPFAAPYEKQNGILDFLCESDILRFQYKGVIEHSGQKTWA